MKIDVNQQSQSSTSTHNTTMSSSDTAALRDELDAINAKVTKQGSLVRELKKAAASGDKIAAAVDALKELKIESEVLRKKIEILDPTAQFNRRVFDELILRKMFIIPSFEIHGGVKGLFDLGPPACAVKAVDCRFVPL